MSWVVSWVNAMGSHYHINPIIFAVLYLGTWPPYVYGWVRLYRTIKADDQRRYWLWLGISFSSFLLPYIYVIGWGRNLPTKFYIIVALFVILGIYGCIKKVRTAKTGRPS